MGKTPASFTASQTVSRFQYCTCANMLLIHVWASWWQRRLASVADAFVGSSRREVWNLHGGFFPAPRSKDPLSLSRVFPWMTHQKHHSSQTYGEPHGRLSRDSLRSVSPSLRTLSSGVEIVQTLPPFRLLFRQIFPSETATVILQRRVALMELNGTNNHFPHSRHRHPS